MGVPSQAPDLPELAELPDDAALLMNGSRTNRCTYQYRADRRGGARQDVRWRA